MLLLAQIFVKELHALQEIPCSSQIVLDFNGDHRDFLVPMI
jgi:hypothetical protein